MGVVQPATGAGEAKQGIGWKGVAALTTLPTLAGFGLVEYTLLQQQPPQPPTVSAAADPNTAATLEIVQQMRTDLKAYIDASKIEGTGINEDSKTGQVLRELADINQRLGSQITLQQLNEALSNNKPVINNQDVSFAIEKLSSKFDIADIRTALRALTANDEQLKQTLSEYEANRIKSAERLENGLVSIWRKVHALEPKERQHYTVTPYTLTRSHGEFRPTQPGGVCLAPIPGTPRKFVTENVFVRTEYGKLFATCASANEKLFGVMWGESINTKDLVTLKAELEQISNAMYQIARDPIRGQEFCSILTPSELMEAYQETKSLHVAIAANYNFSLPQTTKTKVTLDMVIAKLIADGADNAAYAAAAKGN